MSSAPARQWYLNTDWLRSFVLDKPSLPLPHESKEQQQPTNEKTAPSEYQTPASTLYGQPTKPHHPPPPPKNMSEAASPPPVPATGRGMGHIDVAQSEGGHSDFGGDDGPAQRPDAASDLASQKQTAEEKRKIDDELADRLSGLIEDSNSRVLPLCKMIRSHIEGMLARPEAERNEDELIKAVKPLLQQAEQILHETEGMVKGADPDKRLSKKATRNTKSHVATPQEQRLAEAVKVMVEEVAGTIEWAKNKLDAFPKAKRDLGPLLEAMAAPLTQIVGGVGLLLAGVLNLVGNILNGLGLGGLLKGLVESLGLSKLYEGLGMGKMFTY